MGQGHLRDGSRQCSDHFIAFFGVKVLFDHFQFDGKFTLTDMIKDEAKGPNNIFSLGMGVRF